jgi:glycosyltransferase involved in cell wall biosynthesis
MRDAPLRLLLVNFEMDPHSQVLSWQYRIAVELASHCERVVVVTERWVPRALPSHVEVHAVPRLFQKLPLRLFGVKWLMNLPLALWCFRHRFHVCFVHMSMEWTYRLSPCLWLFRVPIVLWYAHGSITRRLHWAHRLVVRILTSTPEGCGIPSSKVRVIGQAIDTELFRPQEGRKPQADIVSVGRISQRKQTDLLIDVMEVLRDRWASIPFRLLLIGGPLNRSDVAFQQQLREKVRRAELTDRIVFVGAVRHAEVPSYYRNAFVHLSLSKTGSMDKALMESLACGCPVLTSNEGLRDVLSQHPDMLLTNTNPATIAARVVRAYETRGCVNRAALRALVEGHHDLNTHMARMLLNLREVAGRA